MHARLIASLAATFALLAAPTALGKESVSQTFFREALVKDAKTTGAVKRMLERHAGFIDPRSGFADVTGDGRQDALVLVTTGGAGGTVALYVFSTHGQQAQGNQQTSLKVIFGLQSLYRATLRLNGTTITVAEPLWAVGDDLCCPGKLRERDYGFDPAKRTFIRTDLRDADGPGA